MAIVLNENEWAKDMIDSRSLGNKPSETLKRVARYFLDVGYSKKETRSLLDKFLIQCDPAISLPKWSDLLDTSLNKALKKEAVMINEVIITKPELEMIDSLKGKQIRRLAFTLLCLSKYWDVVNRFSEHWVNSPDNEIMKLANINTSIKRQSLMFYELKERGMIQLSKKIDNTNVKVCFAKDGEIAVRITDFRNLGYQYLMNKGEPYFECTNCGIISKIPKQGKGNNIKYCSECASSIAMKQRVDWIMRMRNKDKAVALA